MSAKSAAPATPVRRLPAVHAVLRNAVAGELSGQFGHDQTVAAVRAAITAARTRLRDERTSAPAVPTVADLVAVAAAQLAQRHRPKLTAAVNATGILLHTGLGRAVLPDAARAAVAALGGCCSLQIGLDDGERLEREHIIRETVTELTGAEDVLLVNNNAAATLLVLRALAHGRDVVVSRGELIEIGGSFRLPDIMAESGARLHEIGTTNKTHLRDYERAIGPDTALLLKVHKSNYDIVGFTHEVGIGELSRLGRARDVPVVDDIGCGAMTALEAYGLAHEMTLRESVAAGADLVLSSTDKLIGGPQGGLIVGRRALIGRIRAHPLYRAMRVCKMTYAALEATLRLFKAPERLALTHPLYAMLAKPAERIAQQAETLAGLLRAALPTWEVDTVPHQAFLGGGSLPSQPLVSRAVRLRAPKVASAELARRLRTAPEPIVPRLHRDALLLDMRTVDAAELEIIVRICRGLVQEETCLPGSGSPPT